MTKNLWFLTEERPKKGYLLQVWQAEDLQRWKKKGYLLQVWQAEDLQRWKTCTKML